MEQKVLNIEKMLYDVIMKQKNVILDSLESKKALNFDLNDSLLRKYYPSKNYKKGWSDLKKYFINNGFKHRQYSGYVSKYPISMAEVVQVIKKLSSNYTWLKYCVKEFDVTIVSDEYSMKSYIQPVDVFD